MTFNTCHHCVEPACASVCPVDAISKREHDGVVVADPGKSDAVPLCNLTLS